MKARFKQWAALAAAAGALTAAAACSPQSQSDLAQLTCAVQDAAGAACPEAGSAAAGGGTDPLANPLGISAGLGSVPDSGKVAARELIGQVSTAGRGPKTGYSREEFGTAWSDAVTVPFGGNRCPTREDVLKRDLQQITMRDRCIVESGTLSQDPYTGKVLAFTKANASAIQIDHVAPLAFSWQMGAAQWSPQRRRDFANDPLNLLAVDGRQNQSKQASGPASWLPGDKPIRCAYSVRLAQVSLRYAMPLPAADKDMMLRQCA